MPQSLKIVYYVDPDAGSLARRTARYFVEMAEDAVAARGRARIAISGGSTPKAAFALLADPNEPWHLRMPWDLIDLFWVDERCVPPDHPDSNYRMTREAMLDRVPIPPENVHRMEGELDPGAAAARYESTLRNNFRLEGAQLPTPQLPSFDLIALGMGPDGHTASLFPHTAALHEVSRLVTANHVESQKDSWRITLTWPVINQARSVFFQIQGSDKAQVLKEVVTGPRDSERLPSQLIRPASGILTLLLDKTAAALLPPVNGQGIGELPQSQS